MGKWGQVWDVFLKLTFLLCICILNIPTSVFNIKSLFPMVVSIICFHQPHCKRTFCLKSYWNQTKFQKIKSQNVWTLFPEIFLFQTTFFHRTFIVPEFRTLFPKTFFLKVNICKLSFFHLIIWVLFPYVHLTAQIFILNNLFVCLSSCDFYIYLFFLSILMVIISLELTRVNTDRNIFSINVELTSTFLLYRGLVHHHHWILNGSHWRYLTKIWHYLECFMEKKMGFQN